MKPTDWYDKLMVVVGFLIALNVVPHISTMIREQSSIGQSPWGPAGLAFWLVFWVIYGYRHRLPTVIITNVVGILFNLAYLFTILYYAV
jgi:uncharacterized protein with PQ loop repeat